MNNVQLEKQLKKCVTRGRVLTSAAQLAGYDADALGYKSYRPDAVVIPADADELVQVLQNSKQLDVPVCMRGAGTSLSGGPVAAQGGIVVHTSALRSVRTVNAEGFWCEVECGVALNQLDEVLKPYGLFYPPDPSSGPVCTLGGNVAMNAGGAHCFRYGVTSNYVLGVEAVLPDGGVHRFGGPAGGRGPWREDWKRLMVGSEGTLGAFTRFWLRLLPRPEKAWTFRATYTDLVSAERAIHALVAHESFPVAIELMDPRCVSMVENSPMVVGLPKDSFMILTEIDGPAELVDARVESVATILREAGSADVVFSDDEEQRQKLWKARKAAGGLIGQLSPDFLVQDAVIPKRALAELLQLVYDEADAAGLPAVNVFHAGDGNLHPNFLFDSRNPGESEKVEQISKRLMQRVVEVGGTLSGEHGIGNDKSAYMPLVFSGDALRLQLSVPAVFNPRHQMNPMKVFTARRFTNDRGTENSSVHNPGADSVTEDADLGAEGTRSVSATSALPVNDADDDPRCFEPFLDPIDGILCISADATAADIREQAEPHGLRFPFILDPHVTLREQVAASGFAPASSRFGPVCDNIVGMNWKLPNGRVVRIGERVVKTTTGYDLFRFLLSSGDRFGQPVDYVLRLRTDGGMTSICELSGAAAAVPAILKHCWMHWFDAVDFVTGEVPEDSRLRITINCPSTDWGVVEKFLSSFARSLELTLSTHCHVPAPTDGCPDFVLKTTPAHVVALASNVASPGQLRCVGLCAPGVVHGYFNAAATSLNGKPTANAFPSMRHTDAFGLPLSDVIDRHRGALYEIGGDWHSRHLPPPKLSNPEAEWVAVLEQEFAAP
jgi:glycolate oxidase